VSLGHGAIVYGARIDHEVLIGMRAMVLNGASIGSGSVVAAGSVVTPRTVVPPTV
jgi:carbonic anhydrase/acetyltransferase-like protein (isoleucine patch superfamily)